MRKRAYARKTYKQAFLYDRFFARRAGKRTSLALTELKLLSICSTSSFSLVHEKHFLKEESRSDAQPLAFPFTANLYPFLAVP